jgi:hypothetical protein
MLLLVASSYAYNEIMVKYRGDNTGRTFKALWRMGIGNLQAESEGSVVPPWCSIYSTSDMNYWKCYAKGHALSNILIAAMPQLLISAIYMAVNYQLTVMVHLRDWTRLAVCRQPLRVSEPEPGSVQVSTYWLSLPYRYSIPLLTSSAVLGWLVSQALFSYRLVYYDNDGLPFDPTYSYSWPPRVSGGSVDRPNAQLGLGYSALGVISSMIVGILVFLVSVVLGLQKCPPGLPLGPRTNDRDAARKEVKWGVLPAEDDDEDQVSVQHCTITSHKVESPKEGRWYA